MKYLNPGLAAAMLPFVLFAGCDAGPEEAQALRLLDQAKQAESFWPSGLRRRVPKKIEGVRTIKDLRELKIGRVSMFSETGGDNRLALLAPTGTRHRFTAQLPEEPVLRVGLGFLPPPEAPGDSLRFVIRVHPVGAADGSGETVVDRSVAASAAAGWLDLEIDLSTWSGRGVELSFETSGGGDGPLIWAAWSSPEIVGRDGTESGPDVILISLDTLRADRLSCYGYSVNTSPNLDRLAAQGIRFERAVSQAPWTYPSHVALFSGLYFTARGSREAPTLAEILRAEGLRTEALTGGGQMDFRMGFGRGFDGYRVFDWIRDLSMLEEWLDRSAGRRRFVFLHTYEIHDPYFHTELTGGRDGGRAHGHFGKRRFWGLRKNPLTESEREYVSSLYDGGIAYTDRQLGELFELLEATGALERSIVIVTSDHGEQFWEHGTWRHGMNLYDHQLLVPLIVHLPNSLKASLAGARELTGKVVEQQVRLVDLLPTVLDLLNVPLERRINGRSLVPLLAGEELPPVDAFAEKLNVDNRESKALRTERFKFIHTYPKRLGLEQGMTESWELYDLRNDPGEQTDLAESYPEKVAELESRLQTLGELLTAADEPTVSEKELDPDLEQRLRALGYLE